jgi:hypothetical protein
MVAAKCTLTVLRDMGLNPHTQNQNSAQQTTVAQTAVYNSNPSKEINTNINIEVEYTSSTFSSQNLILVQAKGVLP